MFSQVFVCPQGGGSASREVCIRAGVCIGGLHPGGGQTPPIGYYGIQSTSGRYASYWNAFLFKIKLVAYLQLMNANSVSAGRKMDHKTIELT